MNFVQWAKDNGAIMSDCIQYPMSFNGVSGIGAVKDIPANTVILAIPNKLIISFKKVQVSELKPFFETHPNLFISSDDAEFNCLAIYILYHKLQGEKSFWFPYLNIVQQFTLFEWRSRDLLWLQDHALLQEYQSLVEEMDKAWYTMKPVLSEEYFGVITEQHKDIFYWAYEFVMTRCFGYSVPSTSLVPLADMLNHNYCATTYHLVKVDHEINKVADQKYELKQNKIDLSLFGIPLPNEDIHKFSDEQSEYIQKNAILLGNQEVQEDQKINQINLNVLKLWKDKQIWELDYCSSSDSEDNDSDDEPDRFENIHKTELDEFANRATMHQTIPKAKPVEVCMQLIQDVIPKNVQVKQASLSNAIIKRQESSSSSEDCQSESDEDSQDLEWFDEQDNNIYFSITTTKPIKAGEQVYTFYGKRTNRFLLLWYGFAIQNNKYNSFPFRLWMCQTPISLTDNIKRLVILDKICLKDIINGSINHVPIQELSSTLKLKATRINISNNHLQVDFLNHLRLLLLNEYQGKDRKDILITIPVSIDYELFILQFGLKIMTYLLQKY